MTYGPIKVYASTMATGALSSTTIVVQKSYRAMYLEVPSYTSATTFYVLGSVDGGTTYRRLTLNQVATANAQIFAFQVVSTVSDYIIPMPSVVSRMKVEASAAQTATALVFNFIGVS